MGWGGVRGKGLSPYMLGNFWVFNHLNCFSLSFFCFFINPLNNKKIHLTSREVKVKVYLFCFLPSCCCSVAKSHLFLTPWTTAHQAPLSSTISPNLLKFMSISWWRYVTISSSVAPFSFYLQSFPASGSFPVSGLFTSGDQSIRASASATALPMNIQGWFPWGLTDLISVCYMIETNTTF